jgi:hypothetical protein
MAGKSAFQLSRTKAVVTALVAVGLGLLLVWVGEGQSAESRRTVLTELGAVVISVGVVTVAYEWYLRRTFTEELLEVVGLQQALARVGIEKVCPLGDVDWAEVILDSREIAVLLIDPLPWMDENWPRLLERAHSEGSKIEIFVPHPSENHNLSSIASALGISESSLQNRLNDVVSLVRGGWSRAIESGRLHPRAELTLYGYPGLVGSTAILTEKAMILGISVNGAGSDTQRWSFRFRKAADTKFRDWLRSQLDSLTYLVPLYERKGTSDRGAPLQKPGESP